MTPAIDLANKAKINFSVHEYHHDKNAASYGEEAANALGLNPDQVLKPCWSAAMKKSAPMAVALVPVNHH
ncbi:MAG: hypothetical protein LRY40_03370 [Shewanella fodinae]|nr:hypothetical protein [Shewanella fodinae]